MSSNSKEAPLSDNVSKQLTYDDDGNEDTGRRVKVNKEEKNKKNAKKMFEHNDETAAAVKDVQEGLKGLELNDAEGQGQEHRFEFNADLQTVRVDRDGAGQCCEDEVNGGNARRCVTDADRDERHVAVDATSNA